MGGRGGGSAVSRERMLQDLNALMREQGTFQLPQQIQRAYRELRAEPRDFVSLTELRARLDPKFTREQVDNELRALNAIKGINIIPQSNQKILTPRDRAAMVRIGNEDRLLISMDIL